MGSSGFISRLILISGVLFSAVALGCYAELLKPACQFGVLSVAFFTVFALLSYFWAHRAALSPDRNALTRVVMVQVFLKLLSCLILVIAYDRLFEKVQTLHGLLFIGVYVIFSGFEVSFMTRLGKKSQT